MPSCPSLGQCDLLAAAAGCHLVRAICRLTACLRGVREVGFQRVPTTLHPSNCRATPGWQGGLVCGVSPMHAFGLWPQPWHGSVGCCFAPLYHTARTRIAVHCIVCVLHVHAVPLRHTLYLYAHTPAVTRRLRGRCGLKETVHHTTRSTHPHTRMYHSHPWRRWWSAFQGVCCVSLYPGAGVAQTLSPHAHMHTHSCRL